MIFMQPIRVIVVDDSALVRSLIAEIINRQKDMVCIATACDPYEARERIRELNPDVITLDIEMPKMDGIEFLRRLMRLRPMPVVMVSTLTEKGADITLQALELGAIDFVAKPRVGIIDGLQALAGDIADKIRIAANAKVGKPLATAAHHPAKQPSAQGNAPKLVGYVSGRISTEKLICIGASTGGTEAIKEFLVCMPANAPAVVITQHMPPGFTKSFAQRLDSLCAIAVKEADHGERILPGHAYIAPGGKQFKIEKNGSNYIAVLSDEPPVNRHKPSVEVLFRSASLAAGPNAYAIMFTGMGSDGAQAMREMRDAGSYNYAQDEATCVVFGMPREAILRGAAHEILPLQSIAPALLARLGANPDRYRI
jgi:two-component system chemotaxis response regulator CheB